MGKYDKLLNGIEGKSPAEIRKRYCDQLLGMGIHRRVYSLKDYDDIVLKIQKASCYGDFTNACEWRNYINFQHTPMGKWLAPCIAISPDGKVLVQKRVIRKIDDRSIRYPKKIPDFLTDTHFFNYGYYQGRFVCFDYPFLNIVNSKMKTVRWKKPDYKLFA